MMASPKPLDTYLSLCTQYYDLDKPVVSEDSLAFYMEYAKVAKGPILEPLCGTGRYMIPFMKAGFDIHGFDASPFMLEALHQKCVAQNIKPKVWQGFFEDLAQPTQYSLIFIPCGSLGLIIDRKQVKLCLKKIWEHLSEDGTFVFEAETLTAIPAQLGAWKGSVRKRLDGKNIVLSTLDLPPEDQVETTLCRYDLVEGNAIVQTEIENFRVRFYDPSELCALLKEAGFSSVKTIKAFEHGQTPGGQDEVIVYECRK